MVNKVQIDSKIGSKTVLFIFLSLGFIWSKSAYGKIISGNFADTLGVLLTKNAQNNPYLWYQEFLKNVAIPNSVLFGQLTLWGEALTAISIIGGALYLLIKNSSSKVAYFLLTGGLIGGLFLNINFWLAFSWTSPANDSLNLLMIMVELIGVVSLVKTHKTLT